MKRLLFALAAMLAAAQGVEEHTEFHTVSVTKKYTQHPLSRVGCDLIKITWASADVIDGAGGSGGYQTNTIRPGKNFAMICLVEIKP